MTGPLNWPQTFANLPQQCTNSKQWPLSLHDARQCTLQWMCYVTDRLWMSTDMTDGWQIGSGTRIFSRGIISPISCAFHGQRRQLRRLHTTIHKQLHCKLKTNLL